MKKNILLLALAFLGLAFIAQSAVPTGYYYFARGKKKAELKTTLHDISSPLFLLDYGSGAGFTWEGFYKTDRNPDNTVKDMYSNTVRSFNGFSSIADMAIEHSFPKSWWGGYENYAYRDLFHLYPADAYTNGIKNNFPLGEVTGTPLLDNGKSKVGRNGFGTAYFDNCFEPSDEFKGDFARSYLYIATIYENMSNLWDSPMLTKTVYPVFTSWAIDLLLKWNAQDPVSIKETDRNDSIYTIQGNRNPFIDYPQLADYIWGKDTLNAFDYPAESGAFLISPRRKYAMDFGVIFQNIVKKMSFNLQGVNITSSVSLSLAQNNPYIQLSTTLVPAADVSSGKSIEVQVAPLTSGLFLDTLLIQGGGMTEVTRIPIKILATSEFITTEPTEVTPVGAVLHWLEDPTATNYMVSLYQGDTQAGDLIISGYYEGVSNDKALELYNGTGAAIDLSKYSLKKQTNGAGDFVVTQKLSGTLQDKQTFVIVYNPPSTQTPVSDVLKAKANMFADSICAFNGNDAIVLFRNGVQIDVIGKLNGGADYSWGLDKMLIRNPSVTHPSNHFSLADWTEYSITEMDKIGQHSMTLASTSNYIFKDKSVGTDNQLFVENLLPEQSYTYSVTSYRSGVVVPSVNTQLLRTTALEAPVAMAASEVSTTSFVANWEETPYASGYYMDVYQLDGQIVTETEGFNTVGSGGTPLPSGWSGTASGNYTSTASSGVSPNSIALKNTGEWLQSKTYPDVISKLSFMYRFPSSGTGSYLKVEAQSPAGWEKIDSLGYVNTSKYTPTYLFSMDKGYNAVKFTYYKVSGNLALDDVTVEHGKVDTAFIQKDVLVTGNHLLVQGLAESSQYYYRTNANLGNYFSAYSEPVLVSTLTTGLKKFQSTSYRMASTASGIEIYDLKGNERIRLYSVTGKLINEIKVTSNIQSLRYAGKGVYLLEITDGVSREVYKLVR